MPKKNVFSGAAFPILSLKTSFLLPFYIYDIQKRSDSQGNGFVRPKACYVFHSKFRNLKLINYPISFFQRGGEKNRVKFGFLTPRECERVPLSLAVSSFKF